MGTNIITTAAPNIGYVANPQFDLNEFESAVWNKGYEVILENALRCPCHALDAPLPDCQNCFGSGYFYINPTKTKALTTSLNQTNRYSKWSEELLGTIEITVNDVNKSNLSYMDRVTIKKEYSYFSENLVIRNFNGNTFVFTTYKPVDIVSIHLFNSPTEKLIKIPSNEYNINPDNPYCIIFTGDISDKVIASVYYKHEPEYHVIDLPHMIRASWVTNKDTGAEERIRLPLQAIARLSHLLATARPNFDGSGIITNDNT
jgi:hypothetical protein